MGRFAGYNVVCDLLGEPTLPLAIDWYTTIVDLGPWGAVYTEGWDRRVVAQRAAAKRTKETINRQRIYPPLSRDRREILAAAAPAVRRPAYTALRPFAERQGCGENKPETDVADARVRSCLSKRAGSSAFQIAGTTSIFEGRSLGIELPLVSGPPPSP